MKTQLQPSWGMDPGAGIQPRVYSYPASTANDALESSGVRALADLGTLSQQHVQRRQAVQVGLHGLHGAEL